MRTSWLLVLNPSKSSQSNLFQFLVLQSKTNQTSVFQSNTLDHQVARSSQSRHLANFQRINPSQAHPSKAFMTPLWVLQSNTLHLQLKGFIISSFLSRIFQYITSRVPGSTRLHHSLTQGKNSFSTVLMNKSSVTKLMIFIPQPLTGVKACLSAAVDTLKTPSRLSKQINISKLSNLLTTQNLHDSWVSFSRLETIKSLFRFRNEPPAF